MSSGFAYQLDPTGVKSLLTKGSKVPVGLWLSVGSGLGFMNNIWTSQFQGQEKGRTVANKEIASWHTVCQFRAWHNPPFRVGLGIVFSKKHSL